MNDFHLNIIGTGNAWPVLISDNHPFYNVDSDNELSNAAYLITKSTNNKLAGSVLLDAGFGVIPYLLRNRNRIPDAVILTHAHLDHTVSLDWIVHSYYKKYLKNKKLPLYCSRLCYKTVMTSFPQLEDKIDFKPLTPGLAVQIDEIEELKITLYPVYHGSPARGAGMIRVDISEQKRLLFTGDCLSPVLRKKDFEDIYNIPFLISDANNRFPYPGSNHWSILPEAPEDYRGINHLSNFVQNFGPAEVLSTHLEPFSDEATLKYFDDWIREKTYDNQILSIFDFCQRISPDTTLLVHYGGAEDKKYYESARLNKNELQAWVDKLENVTTKFRIPLPGDIISIM